MQQMQQAVADFVFDLNDCTRRSLNAADIPPLYDVKFREITEKYFTSSGWPDASQVSSECGGDDDFLLLYREMTLRARSMVSGSFKFQAFDFIESWKNYVKLFTFVSNVKDADLMLTSQWIYDIMQEFVYQFQGFCQYRSSVRNEKEASIMHANSDAWAVGTVSSILTRLASARADVPANGALSVKQVFGYFAMIEQCRLECLLGDFSASIAAVADIRVLDRTEPLCSVLPARVNTLYHVGVSLLMLRRYGDAITVFSDVLLQISRVLRPGAATLRANVQALLPKMTDKILALVSIAMALSPGHRVDDQVREMVEQKILDKYRRLQMGDVTIFEDLFESACPKFVSPSVQSELTGGNACQESIRMIIAVFMGEVQQHAALLKLRSYLRMYSSIELSKLARFNESTEAEFVSQLVSYKHKNTQTQLSTTGNEKLNAEASAFSSADIHYYIDGDALMIEELSGASDKSRSAERYFVSGIRKHAEIALDMKRNAKKFGL